MKAWYVGFVDCDRYPLFDRQSPKRAELVREYRASVDRLGVAEIKGFLTPAGIERMVKESLSIESVAFHNALVGNAYLDEPSPELPADHVRRQVDRTALGAVAYDQIPESHLLRQVYESEDLMAFIGDILGLEKIFRYGDPMGALNIAVMKDGDYLRWHFDQTDFVTSLAIQTADRGGEFEFAPMIRTPDQENYALVKAALNGDRSRVQNLANEPGTLVLFRGRYSLHRVTAIEGRKSRLMGLFGYDSKPGTMSTEYLRKIRYGRSVEKL